MYPQQTAIQLANSMIYLLLARFVLNDLPHAAGLLALNPSARSWTGAPSWVPEAWQSMISHLNQRGIKHDVEREIRRGSEIAKGFSGLPIFYLKTVLAGYYLIATGKASDGVVDNTYEAAKVMVEDIHETAYAAVLELEVEWQQMSEAEREEWTRIYGKMEIEYDQWKNEWLKIKNSFVDGNRLDKVIAIETFINGEHKRGYYIENCWGEMWYEVSDLVKEILDVLAEGP